MKNLSLTLKIFALATVFTLANASNGYRKRQEDNLCGPILNVLCVKDVLSSIAGGTRKVREIAERIESESLSKDPMKATLINNVEDMKQNKIRSILPGSDYHNRTQQTNNIDRDGLLALIHEENYAIGYIYNSIQSLREKKSSFNLLIDDLFEGLAEILEHQFICQYRNILHVYSETWTSPHRMDSLQFRKHHQSELSSLNYYSYSIILAQLIQGWMTTIENVLLNLDAKIA